MKKIILVRHGKSAWNNSELTDHDRPLATRGLNDVPMMALRLKEKGLTPDLIITSSAIRATQTS
ncbi:MAG: histidine phosphatase family protein, partial [Algoriphagus sp.]